MNADVSREIERLRREIDRHNELYYIRDQPEITDQEFDALLKRLIELETAHPELRSPDSPSQRVGGRPLEQFRSVRHREPMLSMDNTYNPEELRDFHDRLLRLLEGEQPAYVAEPKVDGVSISLTYEHGVLALGATRGDGRSGDDVTANVRTIRSLPLRLKGTVPHLLEVRGEVFFAKEDFARINEARVEEGEIEFANPRNAASGTLKMLDSRVVAQRPLRLVIWGIGAAPDWSVKTYSDALRRLSDMGLPTSPLTKRFDDFDAMLSYVIGWETERRTLEYEVDGMVVKVDSFEQRDRLGVTSKSPRWQVAYKYAAEQAETRLLDILIQVGRTGMLTPVAHLDPVKLSGTTVSRASLHNDDEIRRKDIRIGDLVVIQKAGEIIPQVIGVRTEKRDGREKVFVFPTVCPVCEHAVQRDEGGVYWRCVNPTCPAQFKNILRFFVNRHAMDIEGVGPALIEQLVDKGIIRSLPDVYRLTADQVAELERMGKKSANNLIAAIQQSKERGLSRLLTGLGIRHVGRRAAEILSEHFGSAKALMDADEETLSSIHEIGPVIAHSVFSYFNTQGGRELVEELASLGVRLDAPTDSTLGPVSDVLRGKSFVVTGTLERFSREEIHAKIKAAGGRVASSISSKTDYLIAGEKAGGKLTKAEQLGVTILSEGEFLSMLES